MSKQNYTIEEMQGQIKQLEQTLKLPGIPAEEAQIYIATIERIKQEIAKRSPAPLIPKPVASPAASTEPVKNVIRMAQKEAAWPREIKTAEYQSEGITPPKSPPYRWAAPQTETSAMNIAESAENVDNKMDIFWSDGFSHRDVTEAIARSRFTSIMRDLEQSRFARQNRLFKLPEYTGFVRARGYYKVLTHFWKAPPTLAQLNINRPTSTFRAIFEMVQDAG